LEDLRTKRKLKLCTSTILDIFFPELKEKKRRHATVRSPSVLSSTASASLLEGSVQTNAIVKDVAILLRMILRERP
jgi:hypothetical protein